MSSPVIVWDRPDDPPDSMGEVLCWQSYAQGDALSSVPRYLEEHAEHLRDKYIAFIHDLGERELAGKRVVEHLKREDRCSFWWMTNLAEKSPFKSSRIYDCLLMLALEEILLARQESSLTLYSNDCSLAEAVKRLCRKLQIEFSWLRFNRRSWFKRLELRSFYDVLPYPLRGLIYLRYLFRYWPLTKIKINKWFSGENSVFLCSYFFNWDRPSVERGEYLARQWEGLPRQLQADGKRLNWIHHFLITPGMPDARESLEWLRLFNRNPEQQGLHSFLETYLSLPCIGRALKSWAWLILRSFRLRNIRHVFSPRGSAVCLWPLLKNDWYMSLSGSIAMRNCLWQELFFIAMRDMPYQRIGLYIWENQGWESALIHAWRRHGHGKIIGIPHATIAFWHMNNFDDPRTFRASDDCAKPLPDILAVNGPMALNAFFSTGYPVERLAKVEAQRFQYLLQYENRHMAPEAGYPSMSCHREGGGEQRNVLILGDFTKSRTLALLQCMEQALRLMGHYNLSITVKFHPACKRQFTDYTAFSFATTNEPLGEILSEFDIAFVSNTTSAGLDALLAGLSVAVLLDGGDFNHSPLREVKGVSFISTARDLAAFLQSCKRNESPPRIEDFFWLDDGFSKWHQMINNVLLPLNTES